jgi:hypothetical protein
LSKTRERNKNELGLALCESGVAEVELLQVIGTRALQNNIHPLEKIEEEIASFRTGEIQGDSPLAGMQVGKGETGFTLTASLGKRWFTAQTIASWRLDLDHLHAQIAQELSAKSSLVGTDIQNPVAR